jgi:hypothetical protein
MNLEDELRAALRPREPSPDFAGRVIAAAERPRAKPASRAWTRWVAAMAAGIVMTAGTAGYRQYQGERAKSQVLLALRITAAKLSKAQKKVFMLNAVHRNNS